MKPLLSVFFSCLSLIALSQMNDISLTNPSFEDAPRKGGSIQNIKGWYDCGRILFPNESAPDIHPAGAWGVNNAPYEGKTYLGLVVRDNETWESVSQKLSYQDDIITPLQSGKCYTLSMAVLRADKYISGSRFQLEKRNDKTQKYNYNTPVTVRIWGGNAYCNKAELLATSAPVTNSDWKTIELALSPSVDLTFITLEAFYKLPIIVPYNGHVLIDDLSDIIEIQCEE